MNRQSDKRSRRLTGADGEEEGVLGVAILPPGGPLDVLDRRQVLLTAARQSRFGKPRLYYKTMPITSVSETPHLSSGSAKARPPLPTVHSRYPISPAQGPFPETAQKLKHLANNRRHPPPCPPYTPPPTPSCRSHSQHAGGEVLSILEELAAHVGADGEAGGHGQADVGHLGQVRALAAQQQLILLLALPEQVHTLLTGRPAWCHR
jgi:hypothetical protein